jgi:hypothetical protein
MAGDARARGAQRERAGRATRWIVGDDDEVAGRFGRRRSSVGAWAGEFGAES